jgi:hypothetical protein
MEFYLHFQNKHLEIIIKKKLFDDLHPFFVKRMKEWNVCCYIYHVEIDELQGALNNMHTKSRIHFSSCDYFCEEICQPTYEESSECVGALTTYPTLTSLWESVVYPRDDYLEWYNKDCLLGTCENYGVDIIPICLVKEECFLNILVSLKRYSTKKILIKKGKEKKKLIFCHKFSSFDKRINYLKLKL